MTQDVNTSRGEDLASKAPSGNQQTPQPLMVEAIHSDTLTTLGFRATHTANSWNG